MFKIFTLVVAFMSVHGMSPDESYELFRRTSSVNYEVKRLHLKGREDLRDLRGLRHFPNLQELIIDSCPNIRNLESSLRPHAPTLRRLMLASLGLTAVPFLSTFYKLEGLNLGGNRELHSIAPLVNLPNLTGFHINSCNSIEDIHLLGQMRKVRRLGLAQVLTHLPNKELRCHTNLNFLRPLSSRLQYLDLRCSITLRSLTPLSEFSELTHLYLDEGFRRTKGWDELEKLRKLQYLHLGNAQYGMPSYRFLYTLPALKRVYVQEPQLLADFKKREDVKISTGMRLRFAQW